MFLVILSTKTLFIIETWILYYCFIIKLNSYSTPNKSVEVCFTFVKTPQQNQWSVVLIQRHWIYSVIPKAFDIHCKHLPYHSTIAIDFNNLEPLWCSQDYHDKSGRMGCTDSSTIFVKPNLAKKNSGSLRPWATITWKFHYNIFPWYI